MWQGADVSNSLQLLAASQQPHGHSFHRPRNLTRIWILKVLKNILLMFLSHIFAVLLSITSLLLVQDLLWL
jgi:hypothetical protein